MREAAELAWQRPSGLGVGERDMGRRHVGLGTCWKLLAPPQGTNA